MKGKAKNSNGPVIAGITLSHPDKILYPEHSVTKMDLARYYDKIAPQMLPELKGRPITLLRCPVGRGNTCFFQKHGADNAMSEYLDTIEVEEEAGKADYLTIKKEADLIYLVQMNVLEIHTWNVRAPKLDRPDRIIFDLDPGPGIKKSLILEAAYLTREFFTKLDLETFVRLSGGKGLHVVVPISPKYQVEKVKEFSKAVAYLLTENHPKLFVAKSTKAIRENRIFIDYLRNSQGATSIANYSTRARENAPIAVPLKWEELSSIKSLNQFTVRNIFMRVKTGFKDPWAKIDKLKQALPKI